jgi:acetyl-CoA carboxylase carboxyl transferase subunit beta
LRDLFKRNNKGTAEDENAPKFNWKKGAEQSQDVPDGMWIKCTNCKELIYAKEFGNNKKVCHKCGYHFRLSAFERLEFLLDPDSFQEINEGLTAADPLNFVNLDTRYPDKIAETRQKTGLKEAIVTGFGRIEEHPTAIGVVDFAFQGGSMGSVYGEKLVRLIETAIDRNLPVITVSSSGGARMQEGFYSLMQMAKITAAFARLGEKRLPYISILADPVTGGVLASYASIADVIIAEPGALVGFTGARVIEQVIKQKLPQGFQTAEFVLEHGMLDKVTHRKELRPVVATLLKTYALVKPPLKTETVQEVVHA